MKKILFVVLALVVIFIAVGYVFVRPYLLSKLNVNDTPNVWILYENKDLNFSLKYPKRADIRAGSNGASVRLDDYLGVPVSLKEDLGETIRGERGHPTNFLNISFSAYVFENRENYEIEEWIMFYREDEYKATDLFESTNFKGIPAVRLVREDRGMGNNLYGHKESTINFFYDGFIYTISYKSPPTNPTDQWRNHPYYPYLEASVPITEAIVDSFRFVDDSN